MRARRLRRLRHTLSQLGLASVLQSASPDIDRQSRIGLADRHRRPSEGWTLIASYQVVYSSDGMAPFNSSIWALIEDKELKYALTTFEKGRTFFLKKIVAVDGLNQGHNRGRAPVTFAEHAASVPRPSRAASWKRGAPRTPTAGPRASSAGGFSRRSTRLAAKSS